MTKKQYENTSVRGGETEGECLLPVVVFCFSMKGCNQIAENLSGQDLLNMKEKRAVRHYDSIMQTCHAVNLLLTRLTSIRILRLCDCAGQDADGQCRSPT